MKKILVRACIACLLLQMAVSCKKHNEKTENDKPIVVAKNAIDSSLDIARDLYLWYDKIPTQYNVSKFATPADLMQDIRQFSKVTGYSEPVDRYSFAMKKTQWENYASGISQDFGLGVIFSQGTDQLYVKSVERASPAGLAGIQRGWRIREINGSTNINTSAASIQSIVQAVFESSSTQFTFIKPDGTELSMVLNAATYDTHPVMADSVFSVASGSKVGYMVFNSFLGDTLDIARDFNRVFSKFATANVADVIIDLRYNGGGYAKIASLLSNYLAPLSANGKTMCIEQLNNKHSESNDTTRFSKIGNLNLSRVFFIVSENTASASESVINNLLPFMTVKLVGTYEHTYGKPVGFFPIPVGDWYVFPVSLRTINYQGNSNYYEGFKVDKLVYDGLNKNWCDVNENCLANTLQYINTGAFSVTSVRSAGVGIAGSKATIEANNQLSKKESMPLLIGEKFTTH